MNFRELLEAQWAQGNFVCVGLDTDPAQLPSCVLGDVLEFNQSIVNATKDLVCAFKPNSAFYEARGAVGFRELRNTFRYIGAHARDVAKIYDAKRVDIGNTNFGYVKSAFAILEADAITVNPYLGAEALAPFLDMKDHGIIVLCRTSNPGAGEFQDMRVRIPMNEFRDIERRLGREIIEGDVPLYLHVAYRVATVWNSNNNCALVVGATNPAELGDVRKVVGDMPILIPGVGFQQKGVPLDEQVRQVVVNGRNSKGAGMIVNLSRAVIYASKGQDFAEAARRETLKVRELINSYRFA